MSDTEWISKFRQSARTDWPNIMSAGRSLFFLYCAWSTGTTTTVVLHVVTGIAKNTAAELAIPITLVVFLVLRDMAKLWDKARFFAGGSE